MKLSRIYSNLPEKFPPVSFNPGLNVVLAEIKLPENRDKDTHNLGKTTFGRLIDFTLLSKKDPDLFLFKNIDTFKDYIFYLEIQTGNNSFLTIRRSVSSPNSINIHLHDSGNLDLSSLPDEEWSHNALSFTKSVELLDGILDFTALKDWTYRRALGYLLRTQEDYRDVFHLHKIVRNSDWVPFVARILGFNDVQITDLYEKEKKLEELRARDKQLTEEIKDSKDALEKSEGLLLLKRADLAKKEAILESFNFNDPDKERTIDLVENIDSDIAILNSERYLLNKNKKKIVSSLENEIIHFNPEKVSQLFNEANILFPDQITKDYSQLIQFLKTIGKERKDYLTKELEEIKTRLKQVEISSADLQLKRSNALSFLSSTDIFYKYKDLSKELSNLRNDITHLEYEVEQLHKLRSLRSEIRTINEEISRLHTAIEEDKDLQCSSSDSLFTKIRIYFSEIIEFVIDRQALLNVIINANGQLAFKADILDDNGNSTSADLGHTYRKLLCIAFDLAVLRAHLGEKYPHFVFHDGLLESLDDRKKENLLTLIRQYSALGIQSIITAIDSDLPIRSASEDIFTSEEIIRKLDDTGDSGRLFNIPAF
ncbi:DUF2326 domain-containing protein [Sutterella sp.]|uniref:DUF2326 domain-containing protein n=1 Tax=Sutterella sp. TaxID=1981025 RepID=UPI0026DFF7F7|nr:DUF2326 domain-containing protein [Sutterella sp.]MDO5530929.1 DUF2326 domain-containing protein [Sutterella sp.]